MVCERRRCRPREEQDSHGKTISIQRDRVEVGEYFGYYIWVLEMLLRLLARLIILAWYQGGNMKLGCPRDSNQPPNGFDESNGCCMNSASKIFSLLYDAIHSSREIHFFSSKVNRRCFSDRNLFPDSKFYDPNQKRRLLQGSLPIPWWEYICQIGGVYRSYVLSHITYC